MNPLTGLYPKFAKRNEFVPPGKFASRRLCWSGVVGGPAQWHHPGDILIQDIWLPAQQTADSSDTPHGWDDTSSPNQFVFSSLSHSQRTQCLMILVWAAARWKMGEYFIPVLEIRYTVKSMFFIVDLNS